MANWLPEAVYPLSIIMLLFGSLICKKKKNKQTKKQQKKGTRKAHKSSVIVFSRQILVLDS